jgi:hypothetical protein
MAYTKHNWVAPAGSLLNRFVKHNETESHVVLEHAPGVLTNSPTPFSAEWMNEIEDGIAGAEEAASDALKAAQSGGAKIPAGASGHLATHSGIEGAFGPPKNPADFATPASVNLKQDKIPAGPSGHLLTAGVTAGTLGTPVNPASLTDVKIDAPVAAYSGTGSRLVYLANEPAAKFSGWIYLIAG